MPIRFLLPLALLCLSSAASARIYECRSEDGRVSFRETPCPAGSKAPEKSVVELGTFDFPDPPKPAARSLPSLPKCGFDNLSLPADFAVYAAGAYSGRPVDFQIDQSGHQATQFDIVVNSPDKPVVLMLGAYEPSVWNIGWTPGTRILAVAASGYHHQAIAGLDSGVPVRVSSYEKPGGCRFSHISDGRNESLNPMARLLFGRPVDMVFPSGRDGRLVVGAALPEPRPALLTSRQRTPESFRDKSAPLAGPAGLKAAVAAGLLRPATQADGDAWVEALAALSSSPDVPPVAGKGVPKPPRPYIGGDAYVVLKRFRFPAGLYGAHSATFFIPRGVPKPEGEPGHSTVYDFNTLRCRGAICD